MPVKLVQLGATLLPSSDIDSSLQEYTLMLLVMMSKRCQRFISLNLT